MHESKPVGNYGYSHWSGRPITPGVHEACFVPQSVMDGWQVYCSCGEWVAFVSTYDVPTDQLHRSRDWTLGQLTKMHQEHSRR